MRIRRALYCGSDSKERQRKPILSVLINLSTRQISLSSSRVDFSFVSVFSVLFCFVPHDLSFWFSRQQLWIKVLCFLFKFSIFLFTSCLLLQTTGFSIKLNPLCCFTFLGFYFVFFVFFFFNLVLHKRRLSGSEMTCVYVFPTSLVSLAHQCWCSVGNGNVFP